MNRPHICFLAIHIYPVLVKDSGIPFVGGAEVQQAVQMRALQRAGYKITALSKDFGQPDVVESDGITIYKIPSSPRKGIRGSRFIYPRMFDLLRMLKYVSPDIVFIQMACEQVASAALYAKLYGKRFVFASASDMDLRRGPLPSMPLLHALAYRLGLRGADAVIVQNTDQSRMLKENFGREGHLIPNGYEESKAGRAAFGGYVLWAATIKPLKRPDLFIELARRMPNLEFVMVGGPSIDLPDALEYVDQIKKLADVIPNIKMIGHVPYANVGVYFDNASMFVNTSDYEGLPNTFMQSWLRGIPSVSFVRPESAHGTTGTLACCDIDEMVQRVGDLMSSKAAWEQASAACNRIFQTYHAIDATVQRYNALFSTVIAMPDTKPACQI